MDNGVQEFKRFAKLFGLILDDVIPNKIVRCSTLDHPEKKNGSYFISQDNAWIMNWSIHEKPVLFNGDVPLDLIPECEHKKDTAVDYTEASKRTRTYLLVSEFCENEYLRSKKISPPIGPMYNDYLVIPVMEHGTQTITGSQLIYKSGDKFIKKFMPGTKTKGSSLLLTSDNPESVQIILCEGYATGLSIRQCCSKLIPVVVCFYAGNLPVIAGLQKAINPKAKILIYADNDKAGLYFANKARVPYVVSDKLNNDANDDMVMFGEDYVRNKVGSQLCLGLEKK
jgi:phage/plasmid primase-like uncharacterized protein